ncbi:MAG: hypothetical protein JST90_09135 [Bacteroidetes bacterium]|nr:hypothetical protein [Bacteroidota bacterium]
MSFYKIISIISFLLLTNFGECQSSKSFFSLDSAHNYKNTKLPDTIMKKVYLSLLVIMTVSDGDTEKAAELVAGAVNILVDQERFHKTDPAFYSWRADGRQFLGDYIESIQDYTKSISLDASNWRTYYDRGVSKSKLFDYRGAISDFNIAAQHEHNYPKLFKERAYAKFRLKDLNGTIDDCTKLINLESENSYGYYLRGGAELLLNYKDLGCTDLSKAGELGFTAAYGMIQEYCQ